MKRSKLLISAALVCCTWIIFAGIFWFLTGYNLSDEKSPSIRATRLSSPTSEIIDIQPTTTLEPWNVPGIPASSEAQSEANRIEAILQNNGYEDITFYAAPMMSRGYQIIGLLSIDSALGNNPQALGDEIATIVELIAESDGHTGNFALHFLVNEQIIRWQAQLPLNTQLSGIDLFYFGGPALTPIYFAT